MVDSIIRWAFAMGIVEECASAGIGGAVIISAGGKESGDKGREIEETIEKRAYEGGLRIIGPNCLGIINRDVGLNASFASKMPPKGKLSFVSQSGAIRRDGISRGPEADFF